MKILNFKVAQDALKALEKSALVKIVKTSTSICILKIVPYEYKRHASGHHVIIKSSLNITLHNIYPPIAIQYFISPKTMNTFVQSLRNNSLL